MTKSLSKAYEEALKELAREMSRQLKRNALADGWGASVATGLSVKYNDGVFETSHNPEHSTEVFDLEYGTEAKAGSATIRRMYASEKEIRNRFAQILEKKVFGK